MDTHKRAIYDDELLNNSEGVYYITVWKFRINILIFFTFSILFFLSKYFYDFYLTKLRVKYFCPLGEDKFQIDKLKFSDENTKMLEFIEVTKDKLMNENSKKIAEDDEYEYYVEK
jgi:hypothetical protein